MFDTRMSEVHPTHKYEDIRKDEVVNWGVTHSMSFVHVVPSLYALNCDRVVVRGEVTEGDLR